MKSRTFGKSLVGVCVTCYEYEEGVHRCQDGCTAEERAEHGPQCADAPKTCSADRMCERRQTTAPKC